MTQKRFLLIVISILMPLLYLFPGVRLPSRLAWGLHVGGMAGISLIVCLYLDTKGQRIVAVLAFFLYSTLLELIQFFHPTRIGSLDDVRYNALGCLVGVLAYLVLAAGSWGYRWWRRGQVDDGLR